MAPTISNKRPREGNKVKIKIRDPKFLSSIQVPTSNRFQTLADNDSAMQTDQAQQTKSSFVSPIVITDHDTNLQPILDSLNVDCNIKIISVGRKILPKSSDDKTKIINALKADERIGFYSYADTKNGIFKVILSGLPMIDTQIIVDSINEQVNVQPTKIIMFESKSTNKLYLLHFNATQVNLKTLEAIKYVYHHVIKWLP